MRKLLLHILLLLVLVACLIPVLGLPTPAFAAGEVMVTTLSGRTGTGTPSASVVNYVPLSGGMNPNATEYFTQRVIPCPGTLKNFYVEMTSAPSAGVPQKGFTFTIRVNSIDTDVSVRIFDTGLFGSDTGHYTGISAGDLVSIGITPTNTPNSSTFAWSADFISSVPNKSPLMAESYLSPSVSRLLALQGTAAGAGLADAVQYIPTDGAIKDLYVNLDIDPGDSPDAYRFTLYLNGNSTELTTTITADSKTGSNTGVSINVVAGDYVYTLMEFLNTPSANPRAKVSYVWSPTVDGETLMMGGATGDFSATLTRYNQFYTPVANAWGAILTLQAIPHGPGTLSDFYVYLQNAPGDAKTVTMTIQIEGTNTSLVVAITGAGTKSGSDLAHTATVDAYPQNINVWCQPTGTPAVGDSWWSLVLYRTPIAPFVSDYDTGYAAGYSDGETAGYASGYSDGETAGYTLGYDAGYDVGYDAGYDIGYAAGELAHADDYDNGYDAGYIVGYAAGEAAHATDYADGYAAGYIVGYADGLAAGGGLPDPPLLPTGLTATRSADGLVILLAWTVGGGSDNTLIKGSTTGYPSLPTEGDTIYYGPDATYSDSVTFASVDKGTPIYFSAWSHNAGGYSEDYTTSDVKGGSFMLLIALILLCCFLTFFSGWRRFLPISMGSSLSWLGLGVLWLISPSTVGVDPTQQWVQYFGWVFVLLTIVPILLYIRPVTTLHKERTMTDISGRTIRSGYTTQEYVPNKKKSSAQVQAEYKDTLRGISSRYRRR